MNQQNNLNISLKTNNLLTLRMKSKNSPSIISLITSDLNADWSGHTILLYCLYFLKHVLMIEILIFY